MTDADRIAGFAVDLAAICGRIALEHFRGGDGDRSKRDDSYDPVTAADIAIERRVRAAVRETFPTHGVIGEELPDERDDADECWVVDPIDGTRGFVLGLPTWGILIGHLRHGRPVFGLMYQPLADDLVYGDARGAYLERAGRARRLSVAPTAALADAHLCCTHPDMFERDGTKAAFLRLAGKVRSVRYGTDCYGYASLALGGTHIVAEGGLKPCDVLPLIPIVEAAGGTICDWRGGSAVGATEVVAAASPELARAALAALDGA